MQEVTVHKDELLQKLRANKNKHMADYTYALKGYVEALVDQLNSKLKELDSGSIPDASINLPKPKAHVEEYDQVITMVEMSVDEEIKLYSQEFAQYVMDNWSWKNTFTATNMMYSRT